MVPTVDLHALPNFAVLCHGTNFLRKGGFSASLNRILRPSGLGLPCVGWYNAFLEDMSKTWASYFIVGSYGRVLSSVSSWLELVMKHSPSFVRIMSKM